MACTAAEMRRWRVSGFFAPFNRFHVLAAMGEAELLPAVPRRRRRSERLDEIFGSRDLPLALVEFELELHFQRLVASKTCRFTMAPAKRDTHRSPIDAIVLE
jgi:hypothetical protein